MSFFSGWSKKGKETNSPSQTSGGSRGDFQANLQEVRESCRRTHARCTVLTGSAVNEIKFPDELGRNVDPAQYRFLEIRHESWVLLPAYEKRDPNSQDWHRCYLAAFHKDGKWRPSMFCLPSDVQVAESYLMEYKRRTAVEDDVIRGVGGGKARSIRDSMPFMENPTISLLSEIERDRTSGEWKKKKK